MPARPRGTSIHCACDWLSCCRRRPPACNCSATGAGAKVGRRGLPPMTAWPPHARLTTGFTGFAECQLHSAKTSLHSPTLGKTSHGKMDLCRVSDFGHSAKTLPRALALDIGATWRDPGRRLCRVPNGRHSAKRPPRVPPRGRFAECWVWHSANFQIFAECLTAGTRQNGRPGSRHVVTLPSAGSWHSANFQIFAECQDFSTRQSGCSADM